MSTILVVDDEYTITRALAAMLAFHGYATRMAFDGKTALASMRETKPDLVLLDVMLPHLSGIEVVNAMDAEAALAAIPIILVSGARASLPRRASGPLAFLQKPFSFDEVLHSVRSMIGDASRAPGG